MSPELHPAVPASLRTLYAAFVAQDPAVPVFAVRCCGRIYLGNAPAAKCRTCDEPPKNVEIRSPSDLDHL